jgi:aspartate kinase/aspartokinase/homoserine dehydrogenase 1
MTYKVVKFGGSNLKDSNGIHKIINAVKAYDCPLVIVVSAFYGVTDQLIDAIHLAVKGKLKINSFINSLLNKKVDLIEKNLNDSLLTQDFKIELEARINKLRTYFLGINYINDVPDFIYDEILSYGERLSSLVLYYILKAHKISCSEVLPENIGLITDGEFKNASVDLASSSRYLNESLAPHQTYVIPGFYGVSPDGKTTLLGRGGSDYAAAALASCLNAEYLDLWKDVEGFLSADPNIVGDSVNVKSLTYSEAAELAYFGSKILHPRTSEPLRKKNIPIRILNINNSEQGINPLSIINGNEMVTQNVVKSVSYSDHFGMLKLHGSGVGVKPGILAKSTACLDKSGINIKSVITSQTTINILLSDEDLGEANKEIKENDIHGVSDVEIVENISLIAAVGKGLTSKYGVAGRIFTAVARKGINVEIICFGTSSVAMYFIVNRNDRDETVRAIHKEFFHSEVCCEVCV